MNFSKIVVQFISVLIAMNYHSAFFIYYSKIYLKCVFWLVYPFSLRFIAYGLLDKQNLLGSDSAGSARWLFTNRFASIILKTKNNNKNRKYHFEPFKFRFNNTEHRGQNVAKTIKELRKTVGKTLIEGASKPMNKLFYFFVGYKTNKTDENSSH